MEMKPVESGENYIMRNSILYVLVILRVYKSSSPNRKKQKYIENLESKILTSTLQERSD
jgi:hypothetical protein